MPGSIATTSNGARKLLLKRSRSRVVVRTLATFLVLIMITAAVTVAVLGRWWSGADLSTVGIVNFNRQLAIPPLAESRIDAQGRRVFDLSLQRGSTQFLDGVVTLTWGINGSYLGPTIRAARGEQVLFNVDNKLAEPTTLHWHGMHLPARMDGGPHQMIDTGSTWSPTWTIDQPAATLWYHPHLHGETAEHVYRGLAGMFIVDDPHAGTPVLPHNYGIDDVPVIVQDKKFTRDGQLDEDLASISPTGLLGDTVVVNGTVGPYLNVKTERVRLRLLNASNSRVYNFGLSDDRAFALVGSDGGLLAQPLETPRVMLSPGERAEIVVSVRPAEEIALRSYPMDLGTDFWNQRFSGGDDSLDILQRRAADSLTPSPAIPQLLAAFPEPRHEEAVKSREFRLSGTSINGRKMDMTRINETVTLGDTELWRVSNVGGTLHNFHVHGVQFQVLDNAGTVPQGHLRGWKDTVLIEPDTSMTLLMRFAGYADPDFPYMFHCHLLTHEDRGMMGQFLVVEPGYQEGPPDVHDHSR
jgi:FtsP/CotA-like multicopper oxidase with cupredoxin domain